MQAGSDVRNYDREAELKKLHEEIEGQTYLTEALKEQTEIMNERNKLVASLNKNPNNAEGVARLAELEKEWKQVQENIEAFKKYANEKQKAKIEVNNAKYASAQLDTQKQEQVMVDDLIKLYKQLGDAYEKMVKLKRDDPNRELASTQVKNINEQINGILRLNAALAENRDVQNARDTANARQESAEVERLVDLYKQLGDAYEKSIKLDTNDPRKQAADANVESIREEIKAIIELNNALEYNDKVTAARSEFNSRSEAVEVEKLVDLYKQLGDAYEKSLKLNADDPRKKDAEANVEAIREEIKAVLELNGALEYNSQVSAARSEFNNRSEAAQVEELLGLYKSLGDAYTQMSKLKDNDPNKLTYAKQANDIEEQIKNIRELNAALWEKRAIQEAEQSAQNIKVFSDENEMIKALEEQTRRLTEAVREYKQAKGNNDKDGMAYWREQANAANEVTKSLAEQAQKSGIKNNVEAEVTKHLQKQKQELDGIDKLEKSHGTELQGILNRYLSIGIVMRELRKLWGDAIRYVSEYYDKMNEIRVVTGKTQQQADQLGDSLRKMASEYSVSSTEMAEGAVTFYRQGLSDSEVEDRLRTVTQFAKTANLSFAETSEIITAVVNSYRNYVDAAGEVGVSSEKVSDIFTTLGNSAGTSATELGKAAQVVAAYGSSVGLSLEKLSAYIATLSESTRLAPETIGRSLQSIMSRMQNLKMKGYTDSEDGDNTSLNDVAKALNTINVSLMDSAGNWRNIDDVFDDIAAKWNTMTDKQQAFISTTIAGTRQKNYFTALMQDMAGAQRSAELYELALNSAGSTSKAFATWTESVAAAQNRLQIALQNTYSALNGEWIKDVYNFGASLVEGFNAAAEASNGLNVKLGILIPSLIQILRLINGGGIGNIGATIAKAFSEHPIILFTVAVGGAIAALSALINLANPKNIDISGLMDDASKAVDRATDSVKSFNDEQAKIMSTNDQLESLRQEYIDLSTKTSQTADDQKRLLEIYDEIEKLAPGLIDSIGGMGDKYGYQKEVVEALNSELRDNIDLLREQQRVQLDSTLESSIDKLADARKGVIKQNPYGQVALEQFAKDQVARGLYVEENGKYYRVDRDKNTNQLATTGSAVGLEDMLLDRVMS